MALHQLTAPKSAWILAAAVLLNVAACARPPAARRQAPAKAAVVPPKPETKAPAKPAGPATEPDGAKTADDEQPITAAGLVMTLGLHVGAGPLELREAYLGVVEKALGKPLVPESRLLALVLSQEETLVGAVLGVLPPDHEYCTEEPAKRARAFWLTPTGPQKDGLRLVELTTQVFDGASPELEAPETYPDVPFLELRGTRECPVPGADGPVDGTESRVMEAWALTAQGPRLVRRLESGSQIPAGATRTTSGALTWIHLEGGAFYLAARSYSYFSTPANSAPGPGDDDADTVIVRCSAETTVYELDAKGQAVALTAKQVAALRKTNPALRALPPDGRGTSEDACSTLDM